MHTHYRLDVVSIIFSNTLHIFAIMCACDDVRYQSSNSWPEQDQT